MTGKEVDKGTIPDRGLLGWDPRAGWSLGDGQSGKELQAEVNTHTQTHGCQRMGAGGGARSYGRAGCKKNADPGCTVLAGGISLPGGH